MDTIEIQTHLSKIHPSLEGNVYAANRLPVYVATPYYMISNLDPDTKPGSHWIAIHIDRNRIGHYFDSYGRKPTGYHLTFLNRNSRVWDFNCVRIQNDWTTVCGEYSIMYLYHKFQGKSTIDFIHVFGSNTVLNDILLYLWFRSCFK